MPWKHKAIQASLCGSPITDYVNAWHSAHEIKNKNNERFIEIKIKKDESPIMVKEDYSKELKTDMAALHPEANVAKQLETIDRWKGDNPGGCFG